MTKRMLIDAAHPEETRVAVLQSDRVEEFDIESSAKRQLRGNIYLAKVARVEPSLQAAFVDYGGNRHGFLAFSEIHPDYYQIPHSDRQKLLEMEREEAAHDDEDLDLDVAEGENGEHDHGENGEGAGHGGPGRDQSRRRRAFLKQYKIQEVIKRRQILLVQVVKEERGTKGAALTTYLSLAGRYSVLMPNTAKGGGVSRKISNSTDRRRLKSIIDELDVPSNMGLIIRTAGEKRTKAEIKRDYDYLLRLYESIRATTLESTAPALIYEEGSLVKRAIRDLYDKDIDEVLVEGDDAYKEAKAFMRMLMPSHAKRVQPYKENAPLFLHFGAENQLENIYSETVQLRSGGYIVINQTEALVAIDVNSGRSTRERSIEHTALKTNLEAAEEAARQMRLRDLAGLIVIDFIDMDESKNVRAVEKRMKDALKTDRARVQMGRLSSFGLLELSRQRRRASVLEGSTDKCPRCRGAGVVRSVANSALQALRAIEAEGVKGRTAALQLRAPTEVALYILNEKREHVRRIEDRCSMHVLVTADDTLHTPDIEIERLETRTEAAPIKPRLTPTDGFEAHDDAVADIEDVDEEDEAERAPPKAAAPSGQSGARVREETAERSETDEEDSEAKKRRRRGRRGGRRRRKPGGETAAGQATPAGMEMIAPEGEDGDMDADGPLDFSAPAVGEIDEDGELLEAAADKPKPKTRRRVRRSARAAGEAGQSASGETDEPVEAEAEFAEQAGAEGQNEADTGAEAEAEAEPKPKTRRRRASAKSAEAAGAEASAEIEPALLEADEDEQPAPAPAPAPSPAREPAMADAEARPYEVQTIRPGADQPAADDTAADAEKPKKRGWWQRNILGQG